MVSHNYQGESDFFLKEIFNKITQYLNSCQNKTF